MNENGNDSNLPPTESRTKAYNTYMEMPLMRVGNVRPTTTTTNQVPTNVEALVELKTHLEGENQQLRKQLAMKDSERLIAHAVLEQKVSHLQN